MPAAGCRTRNTRHDRARALLCFCVLASTLLPLATRFQPQQPYAVVLTGKSVIHDALMRAGAAQDS